MSDETEDQVSLGSLLPDLEKIKKYFEKYGGSSESVSDNSLQSSLSEGARDLPIIVSIDYPEFVYFRLFLFPNSEVSVLVDFDQLLRISDEAPVVKLAIDSTRKLVACVEYPLIALNYDLFERTIDIYFSFIDTFYDAIVKVVDN